MATQTKKTPAQDSNKPVQVFRLRGVKAAVFENKTTSDGKEITFHKVSLQRVYREGNEFKTTTSLSRDDLPVARLLLQRAWEWIMEAEANNRKDENQE